MFFYLVYYILFFLGKFIIVITPVLHMKSIYKKIWQFAQPYYQKGRPMDIDHIEWMMSDAVSVCEKEKLDDSLLLPLVILHDVGYANLPSQHPFSISSKQEHMKKGAEIAQEILEKVGYPKNKIRQITYFISVHDNWLLGDDIVFKENIILAVFNDLDYMWMATPKGFLFLRTQLHKSPLEMLQFLETNEKLKRRPFSTKTTKKLYGHYIVDRKKEFLLL